MAGVSRGRSVTEEMAYDRLMDPLSEEWPLTGSGRIEWEQAAAAVLRKVRRMTDDQDPGDVLRVLSRQSLDGVVTPAIGFKTDVADLPDIGLPGHPPYVRGSDLHTGGWDIRIPLADSDLARATRNVLTDLERGGSSLWIAVGKTGTAVADLPDLLAGVYLDFAPVILEPDETTEELHVAQAFLEILTARGLSPAPGSNFGADPIGAVAQSPDGAANLAGVCGQLAELATYPGLRAFVVDGTVVHDAGATDAQEIAYTIASGIGYLRMLVEYGLSPERAASLLEFRYAATDNQFPTIAKFRAARKLWNRVTELSGISTGSRGQRQHAVTSRAMMTRYDPSVNMLRTTVAAFAAGAGGAQAITVLPYDDAVGVSDDMARRVARNTSSLLISEAHTAKVADPAGGSYAAELLTDAVAKAAWAEFQTIERAGGILAALADGSFASLISATAEKRSDLVARRRIPLTGLSEFPLAQEVSLVRPAHSRIRAGGPFAARRYGEAFENLRDHPVPTPVFLAAVGSVAAHTARAAFTANLLTAGGISVERPTSAQTVDQLVAAFAQSGTTVVGVVGADPDYRSDGRFLVEKLREAGAQWVFLAGNPPEEITDVVDDHVTAGSDVVDFLRRTRGKLSGAA